jgi:hypothetical protein
MRSHGSDQQLAGPYGCTCYRQKDWDYVGNGEIFARKRLARTITLPGGLKYDEDTTFTLHHDPVP